MMLLITEAFLGLKPSVADSHPILQKCSWHMSLRTYEISQASLREREPSTGVHVA